MFYVSDELVTVSIHAPARGATCDSGVIGHDDLKVSIHAPARGATARDHGRYVEQSCFNPRPRAGGDFAAYEHKVLYMFQSTPPRGGRPHRCLQRSTLYVFQSTPPRGGRPGHVMHSGRLPVSIHAPARGATRDEIAQVVPMARVSIHAPARGATEMCARQLILLSVFQSTPPRGGRPYDRHGLAP